MDLTAGYVVAINEPVFTGSFRNAKYSHHVQWIGQIIKDSYGTKSGQHTFTLLILDVGTAFTNNSVGTKTTRKGRTLYKNIEQILAEPVQKEILAHDKHTRATTQAARNKQRSVFK